MHATGAAQNALDVLDQVRPAGVTMAMLLDELQRALGRTKEPEVPEIELPYDTTGVTIVRTIEGEPCCSDSCQHLLGKGCAISGRPTQGGILCVPTLANERVQALNRIEGYETKNVATPLEETCRMKTAEREVKEAKEELQKAKARIAELEREAKCR
jgi:hypothetical protein